MTSVHTRRHRYKSGAPAHLLRTPRVPRPAAPPSAPIAALAASAFAEHRTRAAPTLMTRHLQPSHARLNPIRVVPTGVADPPLTYAPRSRVHPRRPSRRSPFALSARPDATDPNQQPRSHAVTGGSLAHALVAGVPRPSARPVSASSTTSASKLAAVAERAPRQPAALSRFGKRSSPPGPIPLMAQLAASISVTGAPRRAPPSCRRFENVPTPTVPPMRRAPSPFYACSAWRPGRRHMIRSVA